MPICAYMYIYMHTQGLNIAMHVPDDSKFDSISMIGFKKNCIGGFSLENHSPARMMFLGFLLKHKLHVIHSYKAFKYMHVTYTLQQMAIHLSLAELATFFD